MNTPPRVVITEEEVEASFNYTKPVQHQSFSRCSKLLRDWFTAFAEMIQRYVEEGVVQRERAAFSEGVRFGVSRNPHLTFAAIETMVEGVVQEKYPLTPPQPVVPALIRLKVDAAGYVCLTPREAVNLLAMAEQHAEKGAP